MKIQFAVLTALLFFLCGLFFCFQIIQLKMPLDIDVVQVNRIIQKAEKNWGSLEQMDLTDVPYHFSVFDLEGRLLFQAGETAPSSAADAIRNGCLTLDLGPEKQPLGKLLVSTGLTETVRKREQAVSGIVLAAFTALALLISVYFVFLFRRVYVPFQKLQRFAARVASGNLEAPLQMDRGNLFGAFTESFDIMREELRQARKRELLAQQEKKELIASLSHDIRTPVTSIKLQCEVMEVNAPPVYSEKLKGIRQKAEQIDSLITNLFQATLEELGELSVAPVELESTSLSEMLREADTAGRVSSYEVPGCILRADPLRMEQVIDNILFNSYKYAGTSIRVEFARTDEFLKVDFYDYGPGVKEEEVSGLLQKFYRGSNAGTQDGSGLGLYLCQYFMERMGGDIQCGNWEEGFWVQLLIPLA